MFSSLFSLWVASSGLQWSMLEWISWYWCSANTCLIMSKWYNCIFKTLMVSVLCSNKFLCSYKVFKSFLVQQLCFYHSKIEIECLVKSARCPCTKLFKYIHQSFNWVNFICLTLLMPLITYWLFSKTGINSFYCQSLFMKLPEEILCF